ncbi:MAG: hypothetical protein ACTS4X_01610, partial [Candidatus Hodgkinia cicadicola]
RITFHCLGRSPRPHQSMSSRDAALVVYFCAAIVRSSNRIAAPLNLVHRPSVKVLTIDHFRVAQRKCLSLPSIWTVDIPSESLKHYKRPPAVLAPSFELKLLRWPKRPFD